MALFGAKSKPKLHFKSRNAVVPLTQASIVDQKRRERTLHIQLEQKHHRRLHRRSLMLLTTSHPLRRACVSVVTSKWFDRLVLLLIVTNCVLLAWDSPQASPDLQHNLFVAEVFFVSCFAVEMLLKIVAFGFAFGPDTYLRDSWNVLDFCIVLSGIVSLAFSGGGSNSFNLSVVRALRVLRPLRTMVNVRGLRYLVTAFLTALPLLLNAVVLLFFLFLLWGLIGVQLFKGAMRDQCLPVTSALSTNTTDLLVEVTNPPGRLCGYRECPEGYVCADSGSNPNHGYTSFDNLPFAIIAIFSCISMEGWADTMYMLMDSTHPAVALYFILLMLFGAFFVVNLMLAAIKAKFKSTDFDFVENDTATGGEPIDGGPNSGGGNFSQQRKLQRHESFKGLGFLRDMRGNRQRLANNAVLRHVNSTIRSKWFNRFFMALIIINTVLLAIEFHGMSESAIEALDLCNLIFTVCFCIEIALKVIGLGPTAFIQDRFNIFDTVIVAVSVVEIVYLKQATFSAARAVRIFRVLRMFRVLRVVKLVRYLESLQRLVWVISRSLRSMGYIAMLLLLFMFIFTILGRELFGGKFDFDDGRPRENFDNFFNAFVTVFQILTAEEWVDVMYNGQRAIGGWAWLFFLSWVIIGVYCLLNMFLAIVLQNFEKDQMRQTEKKLLSARAQQAAHKIQGVQLENINSAMKRLPSHIAQRLVSQRLASVRSLRVANEPWWKRVLSCRRSIPRDFLGNPLPGELDSYGSNLSSVVPQPTQPRTEPHMPGRNRLHPLLVSTKSPMATIARTATGTSAHMQSPISSHSPKTSVTIDSEFLHTRNSTLGVKRNMTSANQALKRNVTSANQALALEQQLNTIKIKKFDKDPAVSLMNNGLGAVRTVPGLTSRVMTQQNSLAMNVFNHKHVTDHVLYKHAWFRRLSSLILSERFDQFIICVIAISTVTLAFESPLNSEESARTRTLLVLDVIFTVVFALEFVLKVFVMGLVGRKDAYLGNNWNRLDAFIVLTSVVHLILDASLEADQGNTATNLLPMLRLLRALRPLRLLSRSESMRVVIHALFRTFPAMVNVVVVMLLIWLIFSIMAVQLFKGRFFSCHLDTDTCVQRCRDGQISRELCWGVFDDRVDLDNYCANTPHAYTHVEMGQYMAASNGLYATHREACNGDLVGGQWLNYPHHFDHVPQGIMTLIIVASLEGWVEILHQGQDATFVDESPSENHNQFVAIFFIVFIFIGSFFLISLFVGVVFDNFVKIRDEYTGMGYLTRKQKAWVHTQLLVLNAKPKSIPEAPKQPWRRKVYGVIQHPWFGNAIMGAIIFNVLFMTCTYEGAPPELETTLDVANWFFTVLFLLECLTKIVGLGVRGYFSDNWNRFDFFVVLGSIAEAILSLNKTTIGVNVSMIRVLRIFRVSRLIRVVRGARRLRTLLKTLILSLPSLANVGTLLFLMYYVYSVLGVQLFAELKPGRCINAQANFHNSVVAFVTMFRISTGEDWHCVMGDAANPRLNGLAGWAQIYFLSFIILVMFVTLNLFIAVILDNFSAIDDDEQAEAGIEEQRTQERHSQIVKRFSQPASPQSKSLVLQGRTSGSSWIRVQLTDEMLAQFVDVWNRYDPKATRFIESRFLRNLLSDLEPPLGLGPKASKLEMLRLCQRTTVPLHSQNRIHFSETLYALADDMCGTELPASRLQQDIARKLNSRLPSYGAANVMGLDIYFAVLHAQRAWKRKLTTRHARQEAQQRAQAQAQQQATQPTQPTQTQPAQLLASSSKDHTVESSRSIEKSKAVSSDVQSVPSSGQDSDANNGDDSAACAVSNKAGGGPVATAVSSRQKSNAATTASNSTSVEVDVTPVDPDHSDFDSDLNELLDQVNSDSENINQNSVEQDDSHLEININISGRRQSKQRLTINVIDNTQADMLEPSRRDSHSRRSSKDSQTSVKSTSQQIRVDVSRSPTPNPTTTNSSNNRHRKSNSRSRRSSLGTKSDFSRDSGELTDSQVSSTHST